MPLVAAYHRPQSLDEALELLSAPSRVPLAGGTVLNADREPSQLEAVDLQALGLDEITKAGVAGAGGEAGSGWVRIGATATLDDVWRSNLMPESLRERARAECPSTLRTLATVGGLVATAPAESSLLAALLAHDAQVEAATTDGITSTPLAGFMDTTVPAGSIITAVSIDPRGATAYAGTGRTPADVPIVSAYGRLARGMSGAVVALSGVADFPVLVDPHDPASGLTPHGDFRGSSRYRLHLARVLTARVMTELSR